ncbi:MAG: tRNA uridine(34) 5-carboxymethylaminomethyl modification radical SAM/GNAT enzyme Elp3, partial [bacterium]|nr:tRNA uridine(34) 5-carboxymethylaminomethyl modification radical SAM/GNAT enzyme Elp3 [bacterium]
KDDGLAYLLKTRGIRSLSGIVSVSVLTKPYPCPGKCLYCPDQKGLPKSYLDGEPAVMRAVFNKFNPYLQVQSRLKALENTGHSTAKIELIIIGGTWSFLPKKYQEWFVKECFRAANEYNRQPTINNQQLDKEQRRNENAKHRIIGITVETRPDFINESEIKQLRRLGVTRVEMGVQSTYDDVLRKNSRGHDVSATIKATKLLKDAGFKICYHIMPNLPGSDLKKDEIVFSRLFNDSDFRPDFLKIYPCVVVKQAPLYKLWLKKQYKPYTDKQLIGLLAKVKQKIPVYCRIIRIYRDIPSWQIKAGSKISNLRQTVTQELKKRGKKCLCIRCREVKDNFSPGQALKLFREKYPASGGTEIFLSFEDKKRKNIYSLLRLRLPSTPKVKAPEIRPPELLGFPVLKNAALIREVHTYGQAINFGLQNKTSPQHQGLGKQLIKEAEKISREAGFKKIAVISGIGAKNYYRKLGYRLKETYMVKNLSPKQ